VLASGLVCSFLYPGRQQLISQKAAIGVLVIVTVLLVIAVFRLPRIPQPQSYHHFADERSFLGIHNFGDVVSNLPFAIIGLWGIVFLLTPAGGQQTLSFVHQSERWPYVIVFAGVLLTAFGSSYYHLHPDNARLVWDRLPMTVVFMAMVAAVIVERIHLGVGLWLLPLLVLTGMASVLQWYASELRGAGDLRFYAAVQVYSALILLIALLFPSRYSRSSHLGVIVGFYVLAKALELLDMPIFQAGHLVSGHTLKHLAAAAAGYWILRMLRVRRPFPILTRALVAQ